MLVKMKCCGYHTEKWKIIKKTINWNKKYLCPSCWYANSKFWVLEVWKKIILNPNNI